MNVIDFQKYLSPRGRVQTRAITFAEIFRQRHGSEDDDSIFAWGTSHDNYHYTLRRKGRRHDERH